MAQITLKGNPTLTIGDLPGKGTKAPDFELVKNDMTRVSLTEFISKRVILNIFPSLETSVCAASIRRFNKLAASLENTQVLCISRDLPYTQAKFCGVEGITNAMTASDFATGKFGKDYQVEIVSGPMSALLSRAVVILDENHRVVYTEQVAEIAQEPDYESALASLI